MSPRHASSAASPARAGRARRLLAALGALVALGVLLVGVPVALLQLGSWPITGVPTGDQIRDLPSTVVTDDAVIAILTVLLWVAWAAFVASVLVEIVAHVRARVRGEARPVRAGGGPVQGAARYLVGTIMMSLGPLTAAGSAVPVGAATFDPPPAAQAEYTAFWSPQAAPDTGIGHVLDVDDASWEVVAPATRSRHRHGRAGRHGLVARGRPPRGRGPVARDLGGEPHEDPARRGRVGRRGPGRRGGVDAPHPRRGGGRHGGPPGRIVVRRGGARRGRERRDLEGRAGDPADPDPRRAPAVAAEVTVQPGDNFWDLAEGQLTEAWGRAPTDAEVVPHWQALVDSNLPSLAPRATRTSSTLARSSRCRPRPRRPRTSRAS